MILMDFGLHVELQNQKKSKKKLCRNRARIWRRKILQKAGMGLGWRRGRWSPEPKNSKNPERTETKNLVHAGTCLRQGAADPMG